LIDDENKARRLARAVCTDVMLYNPSVKDAPQPERAKLISGPMKEGRELYAARVSPALTWVFDEAVTELVAKPLDIDARAIVDELPAAPHPPVRAMASVQPEAGRPERGNLAVLIVGAIILVATALVLLLKR
jgi:hypothetical protein